MYISREKEERGRERGFEGGYLWTVDIKESGRGGSIGGALRFGNGVLSFVFGRAHGVNLRGKQIDLQR